jgi:hypothetical protein
MISYLIVFLGICWVLMVCPNPLRFWKRKALPNVGFPNEDSIAFLTALLKIRSAEIANLYICIRSWQKDIQKDENWIAHFLKTQCHLKELKISALLEKRFHFHNDPEYGHNLRAMEDFKILLYRNTGTCYTTIEKLSGLQTLGLMQAQIKELIKEYRHLGSYFDLFLLHGDLNLPFKEKLHRARRNIDLSWQKIFLSFRTSLIISRIKNNPIKNSETLFYEMKAIEKLSDSLAYVIKRKNSKTKAFSEPKKEFEEFIVNNDSINPVRKISVKDYSDYS